MVVAKYYRHPGLHDGRQSILLEKLQKECKQVENVQTELCFYIELNNVESLTADEEKKILWLLSIPFDEGKMSKESHLPTEISQNDTIIEIGPRLNFSTAFSTNAVSTCHSIGLEKVQRIEFSTRYLITYGLSGKENGSLNTIERCLYDQMTHCVYREPLKTFELNEMPETFYEVDVLGCGRTALQKVNSSLGLAFDDWDLDYYTELFKDKLQQNPTNVECFDLAQSNSEHSRHWFFKGRMVIDGQEQPDSLFKMVMSTQETSNANNVIKFNDNSSAIEGYEITTLVPEKFGEASKFVEKTSERHLIFTAETHNFPTGVAPFPGATTGTGGRIRDVQAAGKGAHVIAGTAGYSFGNLNIEGYSLPWEDGSFKYPSNFASPRQIAIEASNGASDYGNKFGEPVVAGFARSFGLQLGECRREWIKPIMFSAGVGSLEANHIKKEAPEPGMEVVKVGGPVYRIGVGGGAASSVEVQGDNDAKLDFGAVQRGDAEMEQKMNRVIRACIEMGDNNPIKSIHDQGAGGNGNVLKEISEPAGAEIYCKEFQLGDPTLTVLELWGAEYQESNAVLISAQDAPLVQKIADREKCPVSFVGKITGDGRIKLIEDCRPNENDSQGLKKKKVEIRHPVDLDLDLVLGSMPRKVFNLNHTTPSLETLKLPTDLTVSDALERVLKLPSVASKRYLTNKVDRSVTGLVAQQQCVGPLHTPLADVAVLALSHFDTVGTATAIGEQPIKGLVDAAAGARMSVGESLTNLVFASITDLKDVKCSGNWMWPAKLEGEGALLFDACRAMCDVMMELGIAIDGGKDSLSMAARVDAETVKAPGTLVLSSYVGCPDITATVTPDLKCPDGKGTLLYVNMCQNDLHRLGGSALAQCYKQLGDSSPDLDDPAQFNRAFYAVQKLVKGGLLKAGHDVSDGGLITCLLEMAFAGNCGIQVDIPAPENKSAIEVLFAEELGLVLEIDPADQKTVMAEFEEFKVNCHIIGSSSGMGLNAKVEMTVNKETVVEDLMVNLRDLWEETSFQLEKMQTNLTCVQQEQSGLKMRQAPPFHLTFDPESNSAQNEGKNCASRPKVGVIREEGSNGDREMVAAFQMAGFEVWDINMQDLCKGDVNLDIFRGLIFVGGFSYADVMGSAKGWAATLRFNENVRQQFEMFYQRTDTFSLGVCNGCQLMALLGWVAPDVLHAEQGLSQGVLLNENVSERFESRFSSVVIQPSPAMMLKNMDGSVLGIWVAHGEGRMDFKNEQILTSVLEQKLAPVRYVDDAGEPTTQYPFNPNGSPVGIAALCSPDGRHLAMMPHPERCVLSWQWPWMPSDWAAKTSPWLRMFQNAYEWCQASK